MLGLPKSTEFNKRIPKQKFYENATVSPALKKAFSEQIEAVYWRNKIAPTTINIAPGNSVKEVEVIEIMLKQQTLDKSVLELIDKAIPHHILFVLSFEDKYQAWVCYKEAVGKGDNISFKVNSYYYTERMSQDRLRLKIDGLDMDTIYASLVRQIAGDVLQTNNNESLKISVERAEKIKQLEKQIAALKTKIHREKQLNRQMEMNGQLKKLKKELEEL
jgi:hypothetical protein